MMKLSHIIFFLLTFWVGSSFAVPSEQEIMSQKVVQCSMITERLERLQCFDTLFQIPAIANDEEGLEGVVPESWLRAMNSEFYRLPDEVGVRANKESDDKDSNAWLTLPAINRPANEGKLSFPTLQLSCINNISRVEIMLPDAIDDGRVQISLTGVPSQYWRSDETGLVFSSGRGLQAIEIMRAIAKSERLVLRSNAKAVDGLIFNTHDLAHSLSVLKQRCGW